MDVVVYLTIVAPLIGLLICLPTAAALWAVLGESHFLIRLGGLLFCIGFVGAFFASGPTGTHLGDKSGVLGLLLFLGLSFWVFRHWLSRLVVLILLFAMLWFVAGNLGSYFFDPQSYAAAAIAIPLGASLVFAFRLLGFRFIRLTGKVSDAEIELGTGISFDAWLSELQQSDGENMTRTEIVSFLRERGVPFSYQRILTDAYEMSIGRRILGVSVDGTPQTVVAHSQIGRARVEQSDATRSRWSVKQLMVLSLIAAGLFALARALALQVPDARLLGLLSMSALCSTLIAIPVLAAELSVQGHWLNRFIYLVVAAVIAIAVPGAFGFSGQMYAFASSCVLSICMWLVIGVTLIRHQGYRIVLVGAPAKP